MNAPPDPDRDRKLLADPHMLDVLRTAAGGSYFLVGPHDRVCRRDWEWYGHSASRTWVVDVSRDEQDSVQRLAIAGLLGLHGTEKVVDNGQTRTGHPLRLTRAGAIALRSWSRT